MNHNRQGYHNDLDNFFIDIFQLLQLQDLLILQSNVD